MSWGVQSEEEQAAALPEPQRAELEAQHVPLGLGAFHPPQRDLHGLQDVLDTHVDVFLPHRVSDGGSLPGGQGCDHHVVRG